MNVNTCMGMPSCHTITYESVSFVMCCLSVLPLDENTHSTVFGCLSQRSQVGPLSATRLGNRSACSRKGLHHHCATNVYRNNFLYELQAKTRIRHMCFITYMSERRGIPRQRGATFCLWTSLLGELYCSRKN